MLGAFLSLAASVLDGCDGEIARLKYQESALGCWIETVGDYSYYIAIFVGLTIGAVRADGLGNLLLVRCDGARRHAGDVRAADLPARADHRRPARQAARDREGAIQGGADLVVADHLADLVRGDPGGDALRHHGVLARLRAARVVVLAAIGANIYWVSLVLKLRHLLGAEEAVAA